MGHTSLVAHDSSQVHRLLGVIFGEGLDLAAVASSPLSGQETQRTMSGSFVLMNGILGRQANAHILSANLAVTEKQMKLAHAPAILFTTNLILRYRSLRLEGVTAHWDIESCPNVKIS